jgi:hypothetical protein
MLFPPWVQAAEEFCLVKDFGYTYAGALVEECCVAGANNLALCQVRICSLNVPSMFPQCSLNVPSMFPQYSLNVPSIFPQYSLNVPSMFPQYSPTS